MSKGEKDGVVTSEMPAEEVRAFEVRLHRARQNREAQAKERHETFQNRTVTCPVCKEEKGKVRDLAEYEGENIMGPGPSRRRIVRLVCPTCRVHFSPPKQ